MKKMANRLLYGIAVVIVAAIILVVYISAASATGATVKVGDNVSVYYTGSFTNGTIFSTNVGQTPLSFVVGSNAIIPGFGLAVIGMHVNQTKTVAIPANEAYGEVNPSLILVVPRSYFGNNTVTAGMTVASNSSGHYAQGRITSVNATNVTINFNPPLAGYTLVFKITLERINS